MFEGKICSLRKAFTTWQKQVGAHSGKRALTAATHSPQAAGETTSMHEDRSHPPRAVSSSGSDLEANAFPCSGRRPSCAGIVKHARLFWRRKSKTLSHKPRVAAETIMLIREMATKNRRLRS
jgi:hypothetical protein